MLYKHIINGVDFTPYIRENGVQQSDVIRNERRVVTLDGVLHRDSVAKRRITVQLMELRDDTLQRLFSVLSGLVRAEYTDFAGGDTTKSFYVTAKSIGVRTVKGGNTYWRNASFTMEEK